jgi:hypothetical protein
MKPAKQTTWNGQEAVVCKFSRCVKAEEMIRLLRATLEQSDDMNPQMSNESTPQPAVAKTCGKNRS